MSVVLGLLLLTAAGLKIHGLTIDPLSQDSFLSSPRLQFATIEVEILLGLWLLSGWSLRPAWFATLAFFGILTGVSLYLALVGQRSCGCLGRVPLNPWITFGVDVLVVLSLVRWRPLRSEESAQYTGLTSVLETVAGAAILLALIGGVIVLAHDNPATTLARWRGEAVSVEPVVSDVGAGVPGESRQFTIQLRNHTDRPVRFVGGTTTCSCIATEDLPIQVPPGESKSIRVSTGFTGSIGRFQHEYLLYTDDKHQRKVVARFVGQIVQPTA